MSYFHDLTTTFLPRCRRFQRRDSAAWLTHQLELLGLQAREERCGFRGRHRHIVTGREGTVRITFVTHYDTGGFVLYPTMRYPDNPFMRFVHGAILTALYLLLATLAMVAVLQLRPGLPVPLMIDIFYGSIPLLVWLRRKAVPARPSMNASSGCAAVLEALAAMTPEQRQQVRCVFCDNGDSSRNSLYRWHAKTMGSATRAYPGLTVLVDWVGDGDELVLIAGKAARPEHNPLAARLQQLLEEASPHGQRMKVSWVKPGPWSSENNLDTCFPEHVTVMACRRWKLVGRVIPFLHTPLDRRASEAQVAAVGQQLARLVPVGLELGQGAVGRPLQRGWISVQRAVRQKDAGGQAAQFTEPDLDAAARQKEDAAPAAPLRQSEFPSQKDEFAVTRVHTLPGDDENQY